ncbi:MAG: glutathione synthase [Deltaproteobacteria bacterium]|nr:glutathione synthase [Deltaproteobacteria bacterium]
MNHLFIVDPLPSLNVTADTTVAFMREAARRGHDVATVEVEGILAREGRAVAHSVPTRLLSGEDGPWYATDAPVTRPLDEFDVVWMRKDPPYDLAYFYVAHLLSLVEPHTLVVNSGRGLREVTEKLFVSHFPDLTPEALVSRSIDDLLGFLDHLGGEMIVKPLDGCGGEGVFHLSSGDRNVRALLEMATGHGTVFQIAQRYVPEIRAGDKRIILLEGEPIGAVLRVPEAWETRANFHVGGSAVRAEITDRDREICDRLRPSLLEHGIFFAGIDVIGDWLTEVNVTSPTGIREINALDGVRLEEQVLDRVEKRCGERRGG